MSKKKSGLGRGLVSGKESRFAVLTLEKSRLKECLKKFRGIDENKVGIYKFHLSQVEKSIDRATAM